MQSGTTESPVPASQKTGNIGETIKVVGAAVGILAALGAFLYWAIQVSIAPLETGLEAIVAQQKEIQETVKETRANIGDIRERLIRVETLLDEGRDSQP